MSVSELTEGVKGATACGGAVERSETEGEHLTALGSSVPFPFRPLTPFVSTFPVNGDSFWLAVARQPAV